MTDSIWQFNPWQPIVVATRVSAYSRSTIYRWQRRGHIPGRLNQGRLEFYLPAFVAHALPKLVAYEQIYGAESLTPLPEDEREQIATDLLEARCPRR